MRKEEDGWRNLNVYINNNVIKNVCLMQICECV